MNRALFTFPMLLIFACTFAQPAIDSTDMPFPHDTIKRTEVNNLDTIDYVASGSNFIWDFSLLNGTDKIIDTFISVNSTPFAYIATYSNPFDQEHRATVATPQGMFQSPPGVTIKDPYAFFKATSGYYGQVGLGAEINGITVPVKFDNADVMYRFPVLMGNVDTSLSEYHLTIPTFGYYGERKFRINYVDGWGTLYLPGDTFSVVRVRSEMQIYDTIQIDQYNYGFGIDRTEIEYKWLAKGNKLPVFQVNKRQGGMGGNGTTAVFVDNRPESSIRELSLSLDLGIWPNPAGDHVYISNPSQGKSAAWSVLDMTGRTILQGSSPAATIEVPLYGLKPGTYLLRLITEGTIVGKILVKD